MKIVWMNDVGSSRWKLLLNGITACSLSLPFNALDLWFDFNGIFLAPYNFKSTFLNTTALCRFWFVAYQWLRCQVGVTGCSSIGGYLVQWRWFCQWRSDDGRWQALSAILPEMRIPNPHGWSRTAAFGWSGHSRIVIVFRIVFGIRVNVIIGIYGMCGAVALGFYACQIGKLTCSQILRVNCDISRFSANEFFCCCSQSSGWLGWFHIPVVIVMWTMEFIRYFV